LFCYRPKSVLHFLPTGRNLKCTYTSSIYLWFRCPFSEKSQDKFFIFLTSINIIDHVNLCMSNNIYRCLKKLVRNNTNLAPLQITNQYTLPVMLSVLLLLLPILCCTRTHSVCPIDNISIQFVANWLLPANCCYIPTV